MNYYIRIKWKLLLQLQSVRLVLVNLTSLAPVNTTELPLGQLYFKRVGERKIEREKEERDFLTVTSHVNLFHLKNFFNNNSLKLPSDSLLALLSSKLFKWSMKELVLPYTLSSFTNCDSFNFQNFYTLFTFNKKKFNSHFNC